MRAVVARQQGGPEVLELQELPDPEPGAGDLLVEVAAAGVNYVDTYRRSGAYPMPFPHAVGVEGAGRVVGVGPGVTGVAVGQRVAWHDAHGSYASLAVVPARVAVPVPDDVDDATAAALPLQGMTAHYLATSTYAVRPGDVVLVHAAAGGVGLLLTQIVRLLGGRVIGTAGSADKAALAQAAGATDVVLYRDQDVAAEVRRLTGGHGVAAVYDGVGQATFAGSLGSLRRRGVLAVYGAASGAVGPVDPQLLNAGGSLFLTRPTLAHHAAERWELEARMADLLRWVGEGRLRLRVEHRYALADARQAHEDLEGRRTTGKLLLLP